MARRYDAAHEMDWEPSTEVRFTSLFVLASVGIVGAILEMSMRMIIG